MAIGALRLWPHLGGRGFRLVMIEVVVAPSARVGIALGILHRHIRAVKLSGEIASSRGLGARAVGVQSRQRELQLLEEDRAFGELRSEEHTSELQSLRHLVC